jgi:hypothetical protein
MSYRRDGPTGKYERAKGPGLLSWFKNLFNPQWRRDYPDWFTVHFGEHW